MNDRLFQQPISAFIDEKLHEAKSRAEKLTPDQLQDPSLAGALEKIASTNFQLATLKPEEKKGKRRTEKRFRIDFGERIPVDVDIIDVSIPFDGWPKSFHLAPSHCQIVETPATAGNGVLQVSFLDDDNLERNVDTFIKRVTDNLVSLEKDLKRIEPQMLQVAQAIANQRLDQIRSRKERDKGRTFPIE